MIRYIRRNIKLLTNKRKDAYLKYYRILGFFPDNIAYYQMALRHRSVTPSVKEGYALSNERLEFLGDAVFNSVVTDILFSRYENKREGFLTNTRSKIVSRDFLNKLAIEIGLDALLTISPRFSGNLSNIYGNAFEALIGAIYLDRGYKTCKQFVEKRLLKLFVNLDQVIEKELNYKSKVIEFCQKHHLHYEFQLLDDTLDVHGNHLFTTALFIEGEEICRGVGANKKESHQQVSLQVFQRMTDDAHFFSRFYNKHFDDAELDEDPKSVELVH